MHHVGQKTSPNDARLQLRVGQPVVEAPAYVALPRAGPVAPQGVVAGGLAVVLAEGVGEAVGEEVGKPLPLLGRVAGAVLVGFGVVQVDGCLAAVEVAAN